MMDNREIDMLVAQKVMGWIDNVGERGELAYLPGKGFCLPNKPPYYSKDLPHYSTDIAAAWQVEQKIEFMSGGYHYEYISQLADILKIPKDGQGYSMGEVWMFIRATPLQRCLAALKAVGVEIEGEG